MRTYWQGDSFDDATKALSDMVLLMQHRNGTMNFKPGGLIAEGVTPSLVPDLQTVIERLRHRLVNETD